MKYRIQKRARGWVVQQGNNPTPAAHLPFCAKPPDKPKWFTRRTWPFHWLAALHLLWLRERVR